MRSIKGHCLCNTIRFETNAAPLWTTICHCESCRRAASAPMVGFMGFRPSEVSWAGERRFYQSSAIATRGFCPNCGSQMSFESTKWPDEIHLFACTLDQPNAFTPQSHCHFAERLDWVKLDDGLERFEGSAEISQ